MNLILKRALCVGVLFALNLSSILCAQTFDEIKKNVSDACSEYKRANPGAEIRLSQSRRETADEEPVRAEITLKYQDESNLAMEYKTEGFESAVASNPRYAFKIVNRNGAGWNIDDMFQECDEPRNNLKIEVHFTRLIRFLPAHINHVSLESLLASDAVECENIETFRNEKNEDVVKIKLKIDDPAQKLGMYPINFSDVEIEFIPKLYGWLPVAYKHGTGETRYERSVAIEYGTARGTTVPLKYVARIKQGENPEFTSEEGTFEYLDTKISKKDFTLSHYGIPEPDFDGKGSKRLRYIIIVAGIVLIVVAARRARQKRQMESSV